MDGLADEGHSGLVSAQNAGVVQIIRSVQKMPGDAARQFRSVQFHIQRPRRARFLREAAGGRFDVYADAHNDSLVDALGQYAADLFPMNKQVVDPLDFGLQFRHLFDGAAYGNGGQHRDPPAVRAFRRGEQQAHIQPRARRRNELPAQPPPARRLAVRRQQIGRNDFTAPGSVFQPQVGGVRFVQRLNGYMAPFFAQYLLDGRFRPVHVSPKSFCFL